MKNHKNIAVTVKLEQETKHRLQKLGRLKQRSTHWLMKQAINQYVEEKEQEEITKQDTIQRWREVEKGMIFQNDEVVEWLDSWGQDNEKDRP